MAFVRASRLIFHFCCTFHWLCSRLAAYRDVVADLLLSAGKVINKIGMGGPNPGIARNGGGELCPLPGCFWRICPQCTEGPPKCSFIPKK